MKKFFLVFLVFITLLTTLAAQDKTKMRPADRLIFTAITDVWSGLPTNMKTFAVNRGIIIDYFHDQPLGTSNFSVAAGLSFAGHNLYSNHRYSRVGNKHEFVAIPSAQEYSNNKLSLNYLNIPLEVRFRTRGWKRNMRIHAGIRGGYLISGHTKYVGEDLPGGRRTKVKEKMLDNIEPFMLGAHARIGIGKVTLSGYMPLNTIFKDNSAADANFFSLGLSFIVF